MAVGQVGLGALLLIAVQRAQARALTGLPLLQCSAPGITEQECRRALAGWLTFVPCQPASLHLPPRFRDLRYPHLHTQSSQPRPQYGWWPHWV